MSMLSSATRGARPELDAGYHRERRRHQRLLERVHDLGAIRVEPRVVERDGGSRGELLAHGQVVVVEALRAPDPTQRDPTDQLLPGDQRQEHRRGRVDIGEQRPVVRVDSRGEHLLQRHVGVEGRLAGGEELVRRVAAGLTRAAPIEVRLPQQADAVRVDVPDRRGRDRAVGSVEVDQAVVGDGPDGLVDQGLRDLDRVETLGEPCPRRRQERKALTRLDRLDPGRVGPVHQRRLDLVGPAALRGIDRDADDPIDRAVLGRSHTGGHLEPTLLAVDDHPERRLPLGTGAVAHRHRRHQLVAVLGGHQGEQRQRVPVEAAGFVAEHPLDRR